MNRGVLFQGFFQSIAIVVDHNSIRLELRPILNYSLRHPALFCIEYRLKYRHIKKVVLCFFAVDSNGFAAFIDEQLEEGFEYLVRKSRNRHCLLYTSDAADDTPCVDLGGRRIIKKKKQQGTRTHPYALDATM
eukprot:TRINITY_DN59388_c0_g1_i1.p1 TRINITY_DN59388_c0_g1~~TRINITY_DN59388_c0_g1_i1.p1  ORF type:complete len:133 (+),score=0.80 TRINITY_DN59388_c0_g1_i1:358-756(+)